MATLREIRKRLHSIENIGQLTKAIEMVSASHLHHALVTLKHSQLYMTRIKRIVDQVRLSFPDLTHPLLQPREAKKIGLVIITADLGLSGSYNKDVFLAANEFLKNYREDQIELILIGRKGIKYYNHRQWPIRERMGDMEDVRTFLQVNTLTNLLIDQFLLGELDEIWCVYTHYTNMFSRKVITKKFLNLPPPKEIDSEKHLDYIFEPSALEVYSEVLRRYCLAKMHLFLSQAYASELSARVHAMKTAAKNAEDMIVNLTLVRNKVRQADITKEMLEITSGAENQN